MNIQGFTTPHSIEMYRMIVIRGAIKIYLLTGMKANRMYTPGNMVRAVTQKTGKTYKRGKVGMTEAFNDLEQWILDNKTLGSQEVPL
jgi:hypothetical protein